MYYSGCRMSTSMYFYTKLAETQEELIGYQEVWELAFFNDPWYIKIIPDEEERRVFLHNHCSDRLENYRINRGAGYCCIIIKREEGKVDEVVGGTCLTFVDWMNKMNDVKTITTSTKKRISELNSKIGETFRLLARKYETEVWYSTMQCVLPSYQSNAIGTTYMFQANMLMVKKSLEAKKKRGIVLKNPPILYGITFHNRVGKFTEKMGMKTVSIETVSIKGFEGLDHYIGIFPLEGNSHIIEDARNMFKYNKNISKL